MTTLTQVPETCDKRTDAGELLTDALPPLPHDQLSRFVAWAGSGDLREWAKRIFLPEVRQRLKTSADAANAFREAPSTPEDRALRREALHSIQLHQRALPISPALSCHTYDVPLKAPHAGLDGLQILFLSDIHFERRHFRRIDAMHQLLHWLDETQTTPDLVILTGDIITHRPEDLESRAVETLDRLHARMGRFFVLGNHDFYNGGPSEIRDALVRRGFSDLTNTDTRLFYRGTPLNLHGVDDHLEGVPLPPRIHPRRAHELHILATHNLDAVQRHFPREIDLILSGHTHAGELNLGLFDGTTFMKLFRYLDGLNGHVRGWSVLSERTLSHITPGFASRFFRFGTERAGASLLTLRSSAAHAQQRPSPVSFSAS